MSALTEPRDQLGEKLALAHGGPLVSHFGMRLEGSGLAGGTGVQGAARGEKSRGFRARGSFFSEHMLMNADYVTGPASKSKGCY